MKRRILTGLRKIHLNSMGFGDTIKERNIGLHKIYFDLMGRGGIIKQENVIASR